MPERERPSLTGLSIKRPLAERGKPVVSIDEAESALLGDSAAAGPAAAMLTAATPAAAETKARQEPAASVGHTDMQQHVQQPVHLDNPSTVQSTILSPTLLKARAKEIKIAWTFKIPHALHQELSAVASYNDLTMSDIVIEAIQFHLPNFPHPPKK